MTETMIKIGMKPPHPGELIRSEVLEELSLSVSRAAGDQIQTLKPTGSRFDVPFIQIAHPGFGRVLIPIFAAQRYL